MQAWSTFISLVCHDDSFLRQLDVTLTCAWFRLLSRAFLGYHTAPSTSYAMLFLGICFCRNTDRRLHSQMLPGSPLQDYNPFATEKTIAEDMSFLRNYNTHRGDDSTSTSDGPREEIKPSPDP